MHHSRQPRQSVTGLFLGLVVILGLVWVDFGRIAQAEGGAPRVVGVATVIDGDTLEVHGHRIRLHAIDAPEGKQVCQWSDGSSWYCGQRAALALADKIGRSAATCIGRDHDRYGRMVAVCSVRGEDLNAGWFPKDGRWRIADMEPTTWLTRIALVQLAAGSGQVHSRCLGIGEVKTARRHFLRLKAARLGDGGTRLQVTRPAPSLHPRRKWSDRVAFLVPSQHLWLSDCMAAHPSDPERVPPAAPPPSAPGSWPARTAPAHQKCEIPACPRQSSYQSTRSRSGNRCLLIEAPPLCR